MPVYAVGQVVGAADVNAWFMPQVVYKPGDTSRSNTTTLAADPDLTVPLASNAAYWLHVFLLYEGSATASQGLKWNFTVPSGANLRYHATFTDTSNAQVTGNAYTGAATPAGGTNGAGVLRGASLHGTLTVSSTSGSFTLQWAQNVSEAAAVTLHGQSAMYLQRIG